MAVTKTARLALTRWGLDTDPWDRDDFDDDNASLEANAAMYAQGLASARPAAGKAGRFYYATDTDTASYDTGAAWKTIRDTTATKALATLNGSFINALTAPVAPYAYKSNGTVTASYSLRNNSGGAAGTLLTLPANYRPLEPVNGWVVVGATQGTGTMYATTVDTNGVIALNAATVPNLSYASGAIMFSTP